MEYEYYKKRVDEITKKDKSGDHEEAHILEDKLVSKFLENIPKMKLLDVIDVSGLIRNEMRSKWRTRWFS